MTKTNVILSYLLRYQSLTGGAHDIFAVHSHWTMVSLVIINQENLNPLIIDTLRLKSMTFVNHIDPHQRSLMDSAVTLDPTPANQALVSSNLSIYVSIRPGRGYLDMNHFRTFFLLR